MKLGKRLIPEKLSKVSSRVKIVATSIVVRADFIERSFIFASYLYSAPSLARSERAEKNFPSLRIAETYLNILTSHVTPIIIPRIIDTTSIMGKKCEVVERVPISVILVRVNIFGRK